MKNVFWMLFFAWVHQSMLVSSFLVPYSLRRQVPLSRDLSLFSSNLQSLLHGGTQVSAGLAKTKSPQFVFVGGKGGVGKTTTSCAIAVALSDRALNTLVVSTDPAHSLGDALDYRLPPGQITAIPSETSLWALEIDIEQELENFRQLFEQLDEAAVAADLGIPLSLVESLGIKDLSDIIKNAPAGIDEIIALSKLFEYADLSPLDTNINNNNKGNKRRFDRIIIDTAPTGHTLRLLQLPDFVNSFAGGLLKVKGQIDSMINSFASFLGGGYGSNSVGKGNKLTSILDKVQSLQVSMRRLAVILSDKEQTQFIVVTIPTTLALQESKRLIEGLEKSKVAVSTIVVNQVLNDKADMAYLTTIAKGQRKVLASLKQHILNLPKPPIEVTEVQFVNVEMVGLYGLKMFSSLAHPVSPPHTAANPLQSRRLTIFGGKGGVGKTTSAASWALSLAEAGFHTLVVSSDPAHSLGDALQMTLNGQPVAVGERMMEGGQLWAMEIDPSQAMADFKDTLNLGNGKDSKGTSNNGLNDIISDLLLNVENPPPGTDEIVAITKVIKYLDRPFVNAANGKEVKFDRIVLDTAPTGHTLRMLALPPAMQIVMDKARVLRDKVGDIDSLLGGANEPVTKENDRLLQFQGDMKRLEQVLHSDKDCEFCVVTIATEVAAAETKRLLSALKEEKILVRRLIVNQLIPAVVNSESGEVSLSMKSSESYVRDVKKGQTAVMYELQGISARMNVPLVKIPYCASEVRTVYGVRYVSSFLFQ